MKIKVKKTDKRHSGHDRYKYYVDISYLTWDTRHLVLEKFFELRVWCWETWGPSREVYEWPSTTEHNPKDLNPSWGWINDQHRARIYLGSKDEAALFTLKWS